MQENEENSQKVVRYAQRSMGKMCGSHRKNCRPENTARAAGYKIQRVWCGFTALSLEKDTPSFWKSSR